MSVGRREALTARRRVQPRLGPVDDEVWDVYTLGGWVGTRSARTVAAMARVSHPQSVTEPSPLDGVDLAPPIPRVPVVIKTWRSLARYRLAALLAARLPEEARLG